MRINWHMGRSAAAGSLHKAAGNRLLEDQHGAVLPVMAAILMVADGGAALAVDVGRGYAIRSELQGAADAAALAAAVMLPDVEMARKAAQRAVDRSLPDLKPLLTDGDLQFGQWNATSRSLDGAAAPPAPFASPWRSPRAGARR